jgi:hypothetical protein
MIDLYCERLGPGLWTEPLNASTSLAFFLVAWLVWRMNRPLVGGVAVLSGLIAAIGVGSLLFHTIATDWAWIADVVPIGIFQITFLGLYFRRVMSWKLRSTVLVLGAFAAAVTLARFLPDVLNGSLPYAPPLAALLAVGWADYRADRPASARLLAAGALFAAAVALRSTDLALCDAIGTGTHFVWHLGAAAVAGVAAGGYSRNAKTPRD